MKYPLDYYDYNKDGSKNTDIEIYIHWRFHLVNSDPTNIGKEDKGWIDQDAVEILWSKRIKELNGNEMAFSCPDKRDYPVLCAYYEIMEQKVNEWYESTPLSHACELFVDKLHLAKFPFGKNGNSKNFLIVFEKEMHNFEEVYAIRKTHIPNKINMNDNPLFYSNSKYLKAHKWQDNCYHTRMIPKGDPTWKITWVERNGTTTTGKPFKPRSLGSSLILSCGHYQRLKDNGLLRSQQCLRRNKPNVLKTPQKKKSYFAQKKKSYFEEHNQMKQRLISYHKITGTFNIKFQKDILTKSETLLVTLIRKYYWKRKLGIDYTSDKTYTLRYEQKYESIYDELGGGFWFSNVPSFLELELLKQSISDPFLYSSRPQELLEYDGRFADNGVAVNGIAVHSKVNKYLPVDYVDVDDDNVATSANDVVATTMAIDDDEEGDVGDDVDNDVDVDVDDDDVDDNYFHSVYNPLGRQLPPNVIHPIQSLAIDIYKTLKKCRDKYVRIVRQFRIDNRITVVNSFIQVDENAPVELSEMEEARDRTDLKHTFIQVDVNAPVELSEIEEAIGQTNLKHSIIKYIYDKYKLGGTINFDSYSKSTINSFKTFCFQKYVLHNDSSKAMVLRIRLQGRRLKFYCSSLKGLSTLEFAGWNNLNEDHKKLWCAHFRRALVNAIAFELEHMFPLSKWSSLKTIAHKENITLTDMQSVLVLGDISNQFMNIWRMNHLKHLISIYHGFIHIVDGNRYTIKFLVNTYYFGLTTGTRVYMSVIEVLSRPGGIDLMLDMHGDNPVFVQNWMCNDIQLSLSFSETMANKKLDDNPIMKFEGEIISSFPLFLAKVVPTKGLTIEQKGWLLKPNRNHLLNTGEYYDDFFAKKFN